MLVSNFQNANRALATSRSKLSIVVDSLVPYLPLALLRLAIRLPTVAFRTLRKSRYLTTQVAKEVVREKMDAWTQNLETDDDDMLTGFCNVLPCSMKKTFN